MTSYFWMVWFYLGFIGQPDDVAWMASTLLNLPLPAGSPQRRPRVRGFDAMLSPERAVQGSLLDNRQHETNLNSTWCNISSCLDYRHNGANINSTWCNFCSLGFHLLCGRGCWHLAAVSRPWVGWLGSGFDRAHKRPRPSPPVGCVGLRLGVAAAAFTLCPLGSCAWGFLARASGMPLMPNRPLAGFLLDLV